MHWVALVLHRSGKCQQTIYSKIDLKCVASECSPAAPFCNLSVHFHSEFLIGEIIKLVLTYKVKFWKQRRSQDNQL